MQGWGLKAAGVGLRGGIESYGGRILVGVLPFLWFSTGWVDFFESGI